MAIKLELGLTLILTIADTIDFIRRFPFFLSLSISSKSLQFRRVILASKSTTMKSWHLNG
jgi:hypothetical protein